MRPVVLGCAVLMLANALACSRNPPSSGAAPPPAALAIPLAAPGPRVTTTSAKLQLATALEGVTDAGSAGVEEPSLSGKVVLHVGEIGRASCWERVCSTV